MEGILILIEISGSQKEAPGKPKMLPHFMKYQFPVPTPEWLHQNLPLLELPGLEFEDYFCVSGEAVCGPELMMKAWSRRGYSGPLHCLFTGLKCSVGIWKLLGGVGGKPIHRNWGTESLARLTIISFHVQVGERRETCSVDPSPKVTGFPCPAILCVKLPLFRTLKKRAP